MEFKQELFTIGHSTHKIEYFIELLNFQNINCLIDVRSVPASKYNPQYNEKPLKEALKRHNIVYMHFKDEFGARHNDEDVLDENGQVNFHLFRKTFQFKQGVERVDIGISKGYKIALMCSEGNPLECHRFSMIAYYFDSQGFEVKHILKNKTLKTHKELEKELLQKYKKKLPEPSLFEPNIDELSKLETAYKLHNKDIGWVSNKFHKVKNTFYD